MATHYVTVESLRPYLTPAGSVALASDEIAPADELDVFGNGGLRPPLPLTALVDDMLKTLSAASVETDAADLRQMASRLKGSLAKVETTLARLDGDKA